MVIAADGLLPSIAGGRPIRENFLTFGAPLIGEEEIREVVDTLRSGWIGFGPKCLRLEEAFAGYSGAAHAVSVNSATAGLHLSLLAAGIGPGDEVITTPLTFVATTNVIEHVGARPVFADVDSKTQNIDPERIAEAVTPRTRAIMPMHMAGRPCNMDAIGEIARSHNLTVIEDAAHAVEAAWNGRKVGSISRFTVFSFYANKNLTTAEGGIVTTADGHVADRLRRLRLHGLCQNAWARFSNKGSGSYEAMEPGYNYSLTDLNASLGIHQLARVEENLRIRERHWRAYDEGLAGLPALETPAPTRPEETHARHLYTVVLRPESLTVGRLQFLAALKAEGIGSGIHYLPVHLMPFYVGKYGYKPGVFPNAERIAAGTISLPMSGKLTDQDAQDVVSAVRKIAAYYAR
ncbi:MAG: DegT/DnrJ/EryC1/StrS family aminotransferase [Terrimicrobiaceae bacterium]|nr:DegT/DnrJ/EryC1/StrS family aminotransferase [Terrimicrobiaceae bacterium]